MQRDHQTPSDKTIEERDDAFNTFFTMFHAQIQYIDRVVDIPEHAEGSDSHGHARLVCVPEARDELSSMD